VSHDAFRAWYETSHSVIAEKYFGHLLLVYRRNYPIAVSGGPQWDYDCITEWVMADEAAFDEIMRIFNDPVLSPIFTADSENMLSPDSVLIKCDPCGRNGTGDQPVASALASRGVS
jgi:hypothetical protein